MDEWVGIDPDNAVPWLAQAEIANVTRDMAGRTNALERAASTRKIETYNDAFYKVARPAIPDNISQLERVALIAELFGFGISQPTIMRAVACTNPEAIEDSRRHQICDSLAELMVTKGTTLFDKSMGVDIGQRLGWPTERVDQLTQERDALLEAFFEGMYGKGSVDSMNLFSCEAIRRQNAFFDKLAAIGEMGAARDFLAGSGSSIEEMARKRKARLEDVKRANQMRQKIEAPPITP